eukprot:g1216.t1
MSAQLRRMLKARSRNKGKSDTAELTAAWDEFEEAVDDTRVRLAGRELVSPDRVRREFPGASMQGARGPDFMAMIMSEERSINKQRDKAPVSAVDQNDAEKLDNFFNQRGFKTRTADAPDFEPGSWQARLQACEDAGGPYIWLAGKCFAFKHTGTFQSVIITVICLAGLCDGLATYDVIESDPSFTAFSSSLLFVFITEMVVKIIANGYHPWRYFTGYLPRSKRPSDDYSSFEEGAWNCFDCIIVCVGIAEISGVGQGLSFLRLLRLLRVLRLLKFWVELVPTIKTMTNCRKEIEILA